MTAGAIAVHVVDGAGAGHLVAVKGERLDVRLDRAFAPGQPGRLEVALAAGPLRVEGRAIGSRREDDGAFLVTFRLVNLKRPHREALGDAALAFNSHPKDN